MATTSKLGALLLGEAILGSDVESVFAWAAAGALSLNGTASFTLFQTFAAVGVLAISAAAPLTTSITPAATGQLRLDGGGANLRVARNVSRLHNCGDPLSTACQEWMP